MYTCINKRRDMVQRNIIVQNSDSQKITTREEF